MTAPAATRNATLDDLVTVLKDEHSRKHDIVVPATKIRAKDGDLIVAGAETEITLDGVSTVDGRYRPTRVCDEGIAGKLDIPTKYLGRLRAEALDLYDANVNGWLRGRTIHRAAGPEVIRPADSRSFLLRCFRGGDGTGVARALLSDSYRAMDNLDVLTAALQGVRDSGTEIEVRSCDLTERRMYVDVFAPQVAAMAPVLLAGYRNPFADPEVDATRQHGRDLQAWRETGERTGLGQVATGEPIVFAGFRISNSEVGGGAFSIVPRLLIQICTNGMTIQQDAIRNVHLGAKLDAGLIQWSAETHRKSLDLITAKARDAVATFLDGDYLTGTLGRIEEQAGKPVTAPTDAIKTVGKALGFTQAEQDGVLDHFIRGGQMTAGGVLNAITSFSQTIPDADRADAVESQALKVLSLV
jgi:hypothetical protein